MIYVILLLLAVRRFKVLFTAAIIKTIFRNSSADFAYAFFCIEGFEH